MVGMKRDYKSSNAQAALEFMVTYGWALLAILAITGILAYYGLLDFSRYLRDYCDFGPQLECVDYQLYSSTSESGFNVLVRNNYGVAINLSALDVYFGGLHVASLTPANRFVIPAGATVLVNYSEWVASQPWDNNLLKIGSKQAVDLVITFSQNISNAPLHIVSGRVFTKVRKKQWIQSNPHPLG